MMRNVVFGSKELTHLMTMDHYIDCLAVWAFGSGTRYDGKIWYELFSTIRSISGIPIAKAVENLMLSEGHSVTIEYKKRIYHGIVVCNHVMLSNQPWRKPCVYFPCIQPRTSSSRKRLEKHLKVTYWLRTCCIWKNSILDQIVCWPN